MKTTDKDVLIIIDVQNDFCEGGNLAVPGGDEVVPIINELAKGFKHVVLTQDWHPVGHLSFASAHPGKEAFTQIEMAYGTQTLWPDHCIQERRGSSLHHRLSIPHAELIIRKGFRREVDSYSAFFENDHKTPTGLGGYLKERGFGRVFFAGLAFDYCVRYSAEDSSILGFETLVIEEACRAIDLNGSAEAARSLFRYRGIELL
ncbi:MAG: bifunctional nicotinamidase/pyrazinamidase [Aestuariivirga sp.]|jgi:nicotinamidase/pyrazinamidase